MSEGTELLGGGALRDKVCAFFPWQQVYRMHGEEFLPDLHSVYEEDPRLVPLFQWETALAPRSPDRADHPDVPWFPVALVGMGQTSHISGGSQVPVLLWRRIVFNWQEAAVMLGLSEKSNLIL